MYTKASLTDETNYVEFRLIMWGFTIYVQDRQLCSHIIALFHHP